MARLIEHFMPVFSFGLALDEKIAQSQATTPVVEVQAEARRLVEHARAAAQAAGQRPEHIEAAAFALVAWIDEIIRRNPAYRNDPSPLQEAMFNTHNAGNASIDRTSFREKVCLYVSVLVVAVSLKIQNKHILN